MSKPNRKNYFLLTLIFLLAACASKEPTKPSINWQQINATKLSDQGSVESLTSAIDSSIRHARTKPQGSTYRFNNRDYTWSDLILALEEAKQTLQAEGLAANFTHWLNQRFCSYTAKDQEILFTGYYRAELNGSLKRSSRFAYPIYSTPKDLLTLSTKEFPILANIEGIPASIRAKKLENKLAPFDSRQEIDQLNSLSKRAQVLVWVDDPIELFFLHIQGSGIVSMDDGTKLEIGYANSNGWPYRSIGNTLIQAGFLTKDAISKQSIEDFLRSNPSQKDEILFSNPSYVFFEVKPAGVYGNLGQKLTAERSVASDQSIYPPAALVWMNTQASNNLAAQTGFALNQDVGGAIKGQHRIDIYFGQGTSAEEKAGYMKNHGQLVVLIPKMHGQSCQ